MNLSPCWLDPCKEGALFFCFFRSSIIMLAKLNSATTLLALITLYIYNNIIIIFQYETKAKTRENRSGVRWQLINQPWFVAWADGDDSKGEVQNKFCYIFQNKNQKNYWGAPGPLAPPSRYAPVIDVWQVPNYPSVFTQIVSLPVPGEREKERERNIRKPFAFCCFQGV